MPFRNQQTLRPSRLRTARLGLERLEDRTVLSSTSSSLPVQVISASSSSFSSSDILVQFRSAPQAVLGGTSIGQKFNLVSNLYEVNLSGTVTVPQALSAYRASANVVFAEPDYALSSTSVPSNTNIAQQWALQAINAQQAWSVTEGSRSLIVAVNDTGVDYTDPDLYLNIWINQAAIPASRLKNLVDVYHDGFISMRDLNSPVNQGPGKIEDLNHNGYIDAGDLLTPMVLNAQGQDSGMGGWVNPKNVDAADGLVGDIVGWNFSANSDNPYDDNGHGTHVAGIIAAEGTNGGSIGIAPNVQLMPVKFLDSDGSGTVSQFIEGLDYEVAHGARISNNSWTGANPSQALTDAIDNARAHGVIIVAAAGNDSANNDTHPSYPASQTENNVVAVAATDQNNNLASFSDYGAKSVTLAAPGVDILSTLAGGGYGDKSGTSMATPVVTGVMALVWSEHPSWSYSQVINQVESTVTPVASLQGKVVTGGVVNAAAAVGAVSATSTGATVLSATASGPSANTLSTIQLTFDRGISPSSFTATDLTLLGPSGRITITGVTVVPTSSDRTFNLSFATQTTAGYYTLYVASDAVDLAGNAISRYEAQFKIAVSQTPPPPVNTSVISSIGSGPSANTLSTIQLTFNRGVSPSSFTAADLTLLGPSGQISITGVAVVSGSNDCTFKITFATQTTAGTYTLYVGRNAKDLSGNLITASSAQFKIAVSQTPPPPVSTSVISSSSSGPSANTLSTIQLTFNQGVSPSSFTAADLTLLGPSGSISITSVTAVSGSNDCTFKITFATQTAAGTYTLYVGRNAKDLSGNLITASSAQFKIAVSQTPPPPVGTSVISSTGSGPSANTLSTIQLTFNQGVSPSSFTAADLTLLGPSGQIAITSVTAVSGSNDCTFKITFATQSATGTYTLYVGRNAKDLAGNLITASSAQFKIANASASTTQPTPSITSFTSTTATTIPSGGRGVSLLSIGSNLTIAHITVKLNIQYPQDGDLYIHLTAPDGTDIVLSEQMGGTTANFPNTIFDDSASKLIAFASGPYTGSYQPLTQLSYLNGKSMQGTWKLWVENRGTLTGTLTGWTLTVTPATGK